MLVNRVLTFVLDKSNLPPSRESGFTKFIFYCGYYGVTDPYVTHSGTVINCAKLYICTLSRFEGIKAFVCTYRQNFIAFFTKKSTDCCSSSYKQLLNQPVQ